MSEEKKMIQEPEMAKLCKDAWPHIVGLLDIAKKHSIEGMISLAFSADGYVSFNPHDSEWEMVCTSNTPKPELRCNVVRELDV